MRTYVPKGREAEELDGREKLVRGGCRRDRCWGVWRRASRRLLIGKDKPTYTPHLDCGDHVIVINAERVRLTGNKIDQKIYRHHSGYPGRAEGNSRSGACCNAVPKKWCAKRCLECCRRTSCARAARRSCVSMPEGSASPPRRTKAPAARAVIGDNDSR